MPAIKKTLSFGLVLLVVVGIGVNINSLFFLPEIKSTTHVQAQVLSTEVKQVIRRNRGGEYTFNRYRVNFSTVNQKKFTYIFDDTLLRGFAPVSGEWIGFTQVHWHTGNVSYFVDNGQIEQRLILGPILSPKH